MSGKPQIPDMTERFMARVLRDEATGCWIWTVRLQEHQRQVRAFRDWEDALYAEAAEKEDRG